MIAITGGAGFLGYHVANYFADKGEHNVLLDIAPFAASDYHEAAAFVQVDVRDRAAMREALQGRDISCIIHAAAALPLWKRQDIFSVNVEGTRNVLSVAQELGIPRVVHISSTAVYGVPKIHPLYEDHELVGVGPYGESKVLAEGVCEEFRDQGLCVPVVRPKTFIGTGRLGVFQILYDWVESGCRIPVIGNGQNHYQLLEVEDLCEAIYLCATGPAEVVNDTFNVGAEQYGTVREDVGALCEYAGWVYGTADTDSFVAVDKLKQALGWQAKYSNAEALIRSYQWYLDHKAESDSAVGITHRVAWNQGILNVLKRILK